MYRRILGPVYDNEKENWRILTNKEIYASVKKPTIIETIRLNRLPWFGHVLRMEKNRIPKRVLYMKLWTARLRGRPRNRWQDWERMEELLEEGGRKKCITERNGRSPWERQGIVTFCTYQWNAWSNSLHVIVLCLNRYSHSFYNSFYSMFHFYLWGMRSNPRPMFRIEVINSSSCH